MFYSNFRKIEFCFRNFSFSFFKERIDKKKDGSVSRVKYKFAKFYWYISVRTAGSVIGGHKIHVTS